jgi:DnaJ-class molecular chaperone
MFSQSVKPLTFVRRCESGECETRTVRRTLTDGPEGQRGVGKAPGTVLMTVLQRPHARFRRAGANLFGPARLSLRNATSG